MFLTVKWPSAVATRAEVWRLLDLSGLTRSVRESRNFTKAGFLYVNGTLTQSLKAQVEIGAPVLLELRFPNGLVKSQEIMPVDTPSGRKKPRNNTPTVLNRRG